jgi:hypothetical protein
LCNPRRDATQKLLYQPTKTTKVGRRRHCTPEIHCDKKKNDKQHKTQNKTTPNAMIAFALSIYLSSHYVSALRMHQLSSKKKEEEEGNFQSHRM